MIGNQDYYRANVPATVHFFNHPLWLDFIAPSSWDVAIVKEHGQIKAIMPFVYEKTGGKYRLVMPAHTKYLGPEFFIHDRRSAKKNTEEMRLLRELKNQLPSFKYYRQSWKPGLVNFLTLYWDGFQSNIRFTHCIVVNDLGQAWNNLDENTRRLIRKAEAEGFVFCPQITLGDTDTILAETFERQNIKNPYGHDFLKNLKNHLSQYHCGSFSGICDPEGRPVAAAITLEDQMKHYLLAGGVKNTYRSAGVNAMLIWRLIEQAIMQNRSFDFLGSMIPSKESFIRSFGGEQQVYLDLIKDQRIIARLKKQLQRFLTI